MKSTQPTLVQKLFSQKFIHRRIKFRNWCLHLKTRVSIQSYPNIFQLFSKLEFFGKFSLFSWQSIGSKVAEKWKKAQKTLSISFWNRKQKLGKILYTQQHISAVLNNEKPNSGFLEISFLHSQHFSFRKIRCGEKVINTVATKESCCFILISGFIDETEKYYTNNKRSLDPSEYKKQRCLDI